MSLLKIIRSKETYFGKIESMDHGSQLHIQTSIKNFENFAMEKYGKANIIPDLKESDDESIFDTLQLWINWTNHLGPKTVRNRFYAIQNYLHYMGIKLHPRDIKMELTFPSIIEEELYGVKLHELQKIFATLQYKKRTMFTCELSGLMRVGEIVQLRKKHVFDMGENYMIKIPAHIAKFNKARTTFWSKEATKLVRPLLKKLEDNDLIFQHNEIKQNAVIAVEQVLRRALVRVGLEMKYESNKRYMINTHSLRAYAITKISRHDENLAKKLAGQKGYLLSYDRIDDDEKLALYQKFEVDLIIDNTEKLKVELAIQKKLANQPNPVDADSVRDLIKSIIQQELQK